MNVKFRIEGMTCSSCQATIQKHVSKMNGVSEVNVNLLTNSMILNYDQNSVKVENIISLVNSLGYKAFIDDKKRKEKRDYALVKLIVSFVLLLILMYIGMGHMLNIPLPPFLEGHDNSLYFALSQFILVIPILVIYRNYFISGYKKLFHRAPNMDSLIALGATASLIYGVYAIIMIAYGLNTNNHEIVSTYHSNLYFESAGMILTLVSLGKYFEKLSKKRTTKSITALMNLLPSTALVEKDNQQVVVPVEDVNIGDILIVKKGDQIPLDGVVVEGTCSVNQANITGESIPVYKKVNDEVFSSTIVNAGFIKVKATKTNQNSTINMIVKLVEEASNSKAPISKLADKISGIFVPIIMSISLLTWIINFIVSRNFELSFNFAISVLVIACPCSLGLATPVAIMVGTGKGAENGLLIKNAEILERAHQIKTIVIDKTGTITKGEPSVVFSSLKDESLIDVIYSFENQSEHPLAKAMVNFAKEKNAKTLDVESYQSIDGLGLSGTINQDQYLIGNYRVFDRDVKASLFEENEIENLKNSGSSPIFIVKNNELMGYLLIKDQIKESSKKAISILKNMGIKVVMLTGDNHEIANNIASEVGIEEVYSEVLPKDKQTIMNTFKTDKKSLVAMVGDGVNDALALTSADLGIAIGSGSDVALESSDIVLLRNDLLDLVNVIKLSKRTLNTIKGNLFWAFFYNCIGVVLASGLFYYSFGIKLNPMIGSLAMSFSSVFVVLNALTINFFKVNKSTVDDKEIIENIQEENNMEKEICINVEGMMCAHCKKRVESAALSLANVINAEASLEKNNLTVKYQNEIDIDELIKKIEEQGYTASK